MDLNTIATRGMAYPPFFDTEAWIRLVDQSIEGFTGCNHFSGTYSTGSDTVTFDLQLEESAECPDESMQEDEAIFIDILQQAEQYSIEENRLSIKANNGNTLYFQISE